jgi:hypothetical protein
MNWKKGDLLVVSVVLLFALALLVVRALPAAAGDKVLYIERNGEIIEKIPLSDSLSERITIDISGGEANIEIEDGRVRMLPLSKKLCPQGICSHVGWVERPGEAIVCLPNRLVLTIAGGEQEEILDGVAH